MMRRLATFFCAAGFAGSALGDPYCADMLDESKMEKRFQYQAPIYNDDDTGWIFGSNQLKLKHRMNVKTVVLMSAIVAELKSRGTDLAIMIAPPRPVIAGQEVLDATIGQRGLFDLRAQQLDFWHLMGQLRASGAMVPNLQDLAMNDDQIRDAFYFHRDTHWTNKGVAYSAAALSEAVGRTSELDVENLPVVEAYEERGSLSDVVMNVCGLQPEPEISQLFDYTSTSSLGLLDDAPAVTVALLGTSFSDRYGKDAYQVADALASALGTGVANHSVTGGGMIGPIETYVLSGGLMAERPELLVWEFPYTYVIRERHLRQILGALRAERAQEISEHNIAVHKGIAELTIGRDVAGADLISLQLDQPGDLDLDLEIQFRNGQTEVLPLRREKRMEEVAVLDTWWADISGLQNGEPTVVSVKLRAGSKANGVSIGFHRAGPTG